MRRLEQYFDPAVSHEEMRQVVPGAMAKHCKVSRPSRHAITCASVYCKTEYVVPFSYRPFDLRWVYWEPETKLLDEKRSEYFPNVFEGNLWFASSQRNRRKFDPPIFSPRLNSLHMIRIKERPNCFPLLMLSQHGLLSDAHSDHNISSIAANYLKGVGNQPEQLFYHLLAALHAPCYGAENAGALSNDWPRIPLPASAAALQSSAALGRQVAALLDTEQSVPGVTVSPVCPQFRVIGVLTAASGQLNPDDGDLDLTAGWGHGGKGGVTMPGKGKAIERLYTPAELAAWADPVGMPPPCSAIPPTISISTAKPSGATFRPPSGSTRSADIKSSKSGSATARSPLLGRGLTKDEARHVTDMARRIAALLLMGPALDANYEAVKRETYAKTIGPPINADGRR